MFGFSDYSEYRRNEQDLDRRAEQARVARERKDTARRRAAERDVNDGDSAVAEAEKIGAGLVVQQAQGLIDRTGLLGRAAGLTPQRA